MRYFASCSFGKDSLAAIICRLESGEPVDKAVYCRIMFNGETSAELPEHEDWIHNRAIPMLKHKFGVETKIVQADLTYTDYFYNRYKKGGKAGSIYGFPLLRGPWCSDRLKIRPIRAWQKTAGDHISIIGIAADETARAERNTKPDTVLPLVDYGVSEAQAFDICKKAGLLSPAYNGGRVRLGCWFCHNQRIGELRRLRNEYPALWNKLMTLDGDSPVAFKPRNTLKDFEERFQTEEKSKGDKH